MSTPSKKRKAEQPVENMPDSKRAYHPIQDSEMLRRSARVSDEDVQEILESGALKQYNLLYYQILIATTNKATLLWRRIVVFGGMTINNLFRMLDELIKFENSSKECKITSFDGKEVKLRGALSPAKATICQVAGPLGSKFSLVYQDYTFECKVEKINISKGQSEHFVPRCTGGGGTLATCKTGLKAGAEPKAPNAFDITHPNRRIVRMRFGANTTQNSTPRELPSFLMHADASEGEYWGVVDTQMSLELL